MDASIASHRNSGKTDMNILGHDKKIIVKTKVIMKEMILNDKVKDRVKNVKINYSPKKTSQMMKRLQNTTEENPNRNRRRLDGKWF